MAGIALVPTRSAPPPPLATTPQRAAARGCRSGRRGAVDEHDVVREANVLRFAEMDRVVVDDLAQGLVVVAEAVGARFIEHLEQHRSSAGAMSLADTRPSEAVVTPIAASSAGTSLPRPSGAREFAVAVRDDRRHRLDPDEVVDDDAAVGEKLIAADFRIAPRQDPNSEPGDLLHFQHA